MDSFREEIVSMVRSCLISTKGQISLRQLEDDYRTLLGERIPYAKLGFSNLPNFIQSVPSLILTKGPDGQYLVDAKVSQQSSHISNMVSKQKAPPKKKMPPARFYINYKQPPTFTNKWRPKNMGWPKKQYENSPRLAAVSHNQFVKGPKPKRNGFDNEEVYKKPFVPSKIVIPETSDWYYRPQSRQLNSPVTPTPPAQPSPPLPPPPKTESPPTPEKSIPEKPTQAASYSYNDNANDDRCSPLMSTKKRITKLMAEIDLDRDSGNSSPTYEYSTQFKPVPAFAPTGNSVADLKRFATMFKLGEVETKFTLTKPKSSKTTQCHCIVKVGQHTYSSYPNDFFDETSAETFTAQKALDELIPKHTRRRSLLISGNDDVLERIPPMLEKHQNAVWMAQIELDYIDKYNEQLPANWLQIIDSSQSVSIEKCLGGYVLKYCKPGDKGKKLDANLNAFDISVPCNTVSFGENGRLYAMVTAVTSAGEIWCCQCGTDEYNSFINMTYEMEEYYTKNKDTMVPKKINFGSCYAVCHESGWVRVRALQTPNEGYVNCFMFDYGEECYVPTSSVYYLRREFALAHAQAFVCRLHGLEELYTASVDSQHIQSLLSREVVLEMVDDNSEGMELVSVPVVMYDMDGKSLNEELITLLTIESATPVLDKNAVTEVHVSNIEPNGDVYVQIRSVGYNSLLGMIEQLEAAVNENPPTDIVTPVTKESSQDRLYFVKNKSTSRWLRASILDWSPRGFLAQVYFIDVGNTEVINVQKEVLYPLDKLDDVISKYPAQALKVRIMIESIPGDFVSMASKLMPEDQMILLKVVSHDNEDVAWVEFFKRSNDGGLFCINKSISVEAELQNIEPSHSLKNKRWMNLVQFNENTIKNVPSGGSLKKPNLPAKGHYLNVNIPFAVNPWNFFVQPLETMEALTNLMEEMQVRYNTSDFSPLAIEDIVPGNIYASRHDDGRWYRTSVLKVIHSGSISVFYCDFGYYTNLTLAQLVPLDLKYMNFPYQALKAKLSGIRPVKNKWTVDDCDLFKNLVTKKQFVSILVDIERDELYRSDSVLKLLLIDTSTEEDIHVRELLVQRGIAVSVD